MTNRKKEIAKFFCEWRRSMRWSTPFCGFRGTTLTVFGITATSTWNIVSVIVNALIALVLGVYAWGRK